MNEIELNKICAKHKHTSPLFVSVCAVDELSKLDIEKKPCFLLANTDYSDQAGSHWVLIFIRQEPKPTIWFDSLGKKPIEYNEIFEIFLKQCGGAYFVNSKKYQDSSSVMCGQFCLYVSDLLSMGENFSSILKSFNGEDLKDNDRLVSYYLNNHMMRDL